MCISHNERRKRIERYSNPIVTHCTDVYTLITQQLITLNSVSMQNKRKIEKLRKRKTDGKPTMIFLYRKKKTLFYLCGFIFFAHS